MEENKKAVVLYSGGLDSRLAICLLAEQGFEITALYFNLPYGCGCCNLNCNFNFTQKNEVKLKVFDVTKEPYLSEYLELIKNPKYGTGAGINPCRDCKAYIFKKAKEFADENNIDVIATGEVLGQRPMSQVGPAMKIIDNEIGYEMLRPLSAKLLKETSWEKSGLVDREKLLKIQGRGRKEQMALADKFKIKYPTPGGGCLLCEKIPAARLKILLEKNLVNETTLPLSICGRHFMIDDVWFVVARNGNECDVVDKFENSIIGDKGQPSVYFSNESGKDIAGKLQIAYETGDNEEKRDKFEKFKI
ncbi:tRNA 4-thiouridine(8) synthase ThiI [archaeon]|jgi:tRNA-uridine 2-sulfurtransferase|nr:tRNA 4-thiouridine(8) synthase ThiI [archaeon]MBT6182333.1 tRNA 4-thiouridine(8) synthase ThiI [archaeon]MBT6606679.1 tRNA 4-thiouridine(8) synthase ThiI [archaeon]MBT7251922.1 tRNA 4-thiouridine(8) synthase ThiI [archaeon]MBT7660485.1 tRNA 4-thiouridine(8) synthase ThiI [archaeon]